VLSILSANERTRFAVGVAVAVLLSFVLVSVFASSREKSRYGPVLKDLEAEYLAADSQDAWTALDESRAQALDSLESRRTNIVITSMLIWSALAAVLLLLWLRVIDWSRWREPAH
jgi:hypothetical protein